MAEEKLGSGTDQTAVAEADDETTEQDDAARLKEALDVRAENVGTLRKKLTITIPREIIDERLNKQYSDLKRDAIVPGFRKGHAPLKLIEKRFGEDIGDELLSKLVSSGYLAAVDKIELKTLGDPLIWVDAEKGAGQQLLTIDKALAVIKMPPEGSLTFSCEVEVRPEFELPELDGIPVEKPKLAISDEDVEGEINRFRSWRAHYVPMEKGAIEQDDLVIADFAMTVDGRVVKEEKNSPLSARGQVIEGVALEDLGDSLVGKKAGAEVSVDATIGDDHLNLDFRGKKATFDFKIHEFKRLELPPLDKEFIESLGFDNEDEMRSEIRGMLESRLDSVIQRGMRGQIGKHLIEKTAMEIPSGVSLRQTERLVQRQKFDLIRRGISEQDVEKKIDELRARAGEEVVRELKLFFVMEKIAEKMEIEVADDELNGAIATIAQQQGKRFDRVRDELSKGDGLLAMYLQIRDDKILDALLEKSVITEVEGPKSRTKKAEKKSSKAAETGDAAESKDEAEKPAAKTAKKPRKKKDAD